MRASTVSARSRSRRRAASKAKYSAPRGSRLHGREGGASSRRRKVTERQKPASAARCSASSRVVEKSAR
jgi:hypothetical protein